MPACGASSGSTQRPARLAWRPPACMHPPVQSGFSFSGTPLTVLLLLLLACAATCSGERRAAAACHRCCRRGPAAVNAACCRAAAWVAMRQGEGRGAARSSGWRVASGSGCSGAFGGPAPRQQTLHSYGRRRVSSECPIILRLRDPPSCCARSAGHWRAARSLQFQYILHPQAHRIAVKQPGRLLQAPRLHSQPVCAPGVQLQRSPACVERQQWSRWRQGPRQGLRQQRRSLPLPPLAAAATAARRSCASKTGGSCCVKA